MNKLNKEPAAQLVQKVTWRQCYLLSTKLQEPSSRRIDHCSLSNLRKRRVNDSRSKGCNRKSFPDNIAYISSNYTLLRCQCKTQVAEKQGLKPLSATSFHPRYPGHTSHKLCTLTTGALDSRLSYISRLICNISSLLYFAWKQTKKQNKNNKNIYIPVASGNWMITILYSASLRQHLSPVQGTRSITEFKITSSSRCRIVIHASTVNEMTGCHIRH